MAGNAIGMKRNVALYPWHHFFHNLVFWQATWFLYFQNALSASEAIFLYVVYDISVTVLEVPSGYMSDRLGRRVTLIASALAYAIGLVLLGLGGAFAVLLAGQILLGAARAFVSGTDTALLYQSLAAAGRAGDMEQQSLRAWRFGFTGLGLSAVTGGAMALIWDSLPFFASAAALGGALICAWQFREPPQEGEMIRSERARLRDLLARFRNPVLAWLFVLGVVMYGYSHIPFVFGQPFIAQALDGTGFSTQAPLVSGVITALMMGLSVLVSLVAPAIRARLGLFTLLLVAFGMQIGLAGALALSGSVFAIALLLLRMVPDSLSTPFIQAHLQPLLGDETRATFMSIKSFVGRLFFAASLWLAAVNTNAVGEMPLGDIQMVLGWYVGVGLVIFAGLFVGAWHLRSR